MRLAVAAAVAAATFAVLTPRAAQAACNPACTAPLVCHANRCQLPCAPNGPNQYCTAVQVCTAALTCCNETVTSCNGLCGSVSKACGGTLDCTANNALCVFPATCGGGGVANVCGQPACSPYTCASINATCGTPSDGCNGTLSCGTCTAPQTCGGGGTPFVCGQPPSCVPSTCTQLGKNCGSVDDGCGTMIDCGTCVDPQTCGGGGVANVCASSTASAFNVNFGAGALVIPMDQCYNPSQASAPIANTDFQSGLCSSVTGPTCYPQNYTAVGDVRLPFGLIYLLAVNHIPVYVIDNPTKESFSDADFTVKPPAGASSPKTVAWLDPNTGYLADPSTIDCDTNPVSYWGMPFVVDTTYAQEALALIASFNANPGQYPGAALAKNGTTVTSFATVPIHVINYPFTAPVLSVLQSRPKPIGISESNFFDSFFDESGITAIVPAGTSAVHLTETSTPPNKQSGYAGYVSTYTFPWSAPLPAYPECGGNGNCSQLLHTTGGIQRKILDVIWTDEQDLQFWAGTGGLTDWFNKGGRALVVGVGKGGGTTQGALTWETGDNTSKNFISTKGLAGSSRGGGNFCPADVNATGAGIKGPPTDYPASDPYLQLGGLLMDPIGGGQAADFNFGGGTAAANTKGIWNDSGDFAVLHGKPVINGVSATGDIIYEGSSTAWNGGSGRKDSGLHIMYDTLINGVDGDGTVYVPTELTRSPGVARPTGEFYAGTFEWNVPDDPTFYGNSLYQPNPKTYPYVLGHFREFRPVNGTTTLASGCSTSDTAKACTWDVGDGTHIKPWASRNVFVGTPIAGGGFTMITAESQASSGDATMTFVKNSIGTKFGGVDYSNPAVVEGKALGQVTIANARSRPTVAYVGARDGMLHCICVKPADGQSDCYGYNPGDEIWALIPPGVRSQMDSAYAAKDWSTVNVGGVVRVADLNDAFPSNGAATTSKSFRTVLLVGTRVIGTVFALDISNPDPANINKDGFQLMWSNDGTSVDTAINPTVYKIGRTNGASLAQNNDTAVAVVTSSVVSVAGSAGVNTYLMRINDGKVIASDQKLHTRQIPIAGGSTAPLPNEIPPVPTLVDLDGDGRDETALVADFSGIVRKFTLTSANAFSGAPIDLYDAAGEGRCSSGISCQPVGVSPTIARRTPNLLTAFVGTGGTDWASTTSRQSYALGFNPAATGPTSSVMAQQLGTVQPPSAAAMNIPIRVYAQLTVAGTDLYATGTTLAINTLNSLIQPVLYPGTYGNVVRFGGLDTANIDTPGTMLFAQGTLFAGGVGGALETNTTNTDGALTMLSTNGIIRQQLAAGSSSLRNKTYAVNKSSSTTRNFSVMTWFDLQN
jgi:hypothetical protein